MCRLLYIVLALKTSKFDTFLLSWRAHTDFEKVMCQFGCDHYLKRVSVMPEMSVWGRPRELTRHAPSFYQARLPAGQPRGYHQSISRDRLSSCSYNIYSTLLPTSSATNPPKPNGPIRHLQTSIHSFTRHSCYRAHQYPATHPCSSVDPWTSERLDSKF